MLRKLAAALVILLAVSAGAAKAKDGDFRIDGYKWLTLEKTYVEPAKMKRYRVVPDDLTRYVVPDARIDKNFFGWTQRLADNSEQLCNMKVSYISDGNGDLAVQSIDLLHPSVKSSVIVPTLQENCARSSVHELTWPDGHFLEYRFQKKRLTCVVVANDDTEDVVYIIWGTSIDWETLSARAREVSPSPRRMR